MLRVGRLIKSSVQLLMEIAVQQYR